MRQVHQITQGFSYGDATSNMALKIQELLIDAGYSNSKIFSSPETIAPTERGRCLDINEHEALSAPENIVLYHFGNASDLSDYYINCRDKKVLIYHNVTPADYFRAVAPQKVPTLERSRDDLIRLKNVTNLACGISNYNLELLRELGYDRMRTFPGWINTSALALEPAPEILQRYKTPSTNILFVGRIAPNKNIEELIKIFYYLTNCALQGKTRLIVAGSFSGMETYYCYLLSLCKDLGLNDVYFTGHISQQMLNACYTVADAFVCTSEHEGFCIPLLEAAHFGLPVFASGIPAIRETMGGSGVIFDTAADPKLCAQTIAAVLGNAELKNKIIEKQKARLNDFRQENVAAGLQEIIEQAGK